MILIETNIMELICNEIISLDNKIRFVGIISELGKVQAATIREDIDPLVSEKDREMLFTEASLKMRMSRDFNQQFGQVNFAIARRDKVDLLSMPLADNLLYITADRGIDFDLVDKVKKILENVNPKLNNFIC